MEGGVRRKRGRPPLDETGKKQTSRQWGGGGVLEFTLAPGNIVESQKEKTNWPNGPQRARKPTKGSSKTSRRS